MPIWGWVLLIACLSGLAVASVFMIVRATHRMRAEEPLHGNPTDIAATVPIHVAEADSMTSRELESERGHVEEADRVGGTPTPAQPEGRRSP
jgi:hypothetical protein